MAFQLVQLFYWLALSAWLGGVLFIAVAAPIVFRTVREANPRLPDIASALSDQHGTLLAGSIVGNILERLSMIQLICGGVVLVAWGAQYFLIELGGSLRAAMFVRLILIVFALGIVAYDAFVLSPRIRHERQQFVEHADEPEVAEGAKARFDAAHRLSVNLLMMLLFVLLGLVLFSGAIIPERLPELLPRISGS